MHRPSSVLRWGLLILLAVSFAQMGPGQTDPGPDPHIYLRDLADFTAFGHCLRDAGLKAAVAAGFQTGPMVSLSFREFYSSSGQCLYRGSALFSGARSATKLRFYYLYTGLTPLPELPPDVLAHKLSVSQDASPTLDVEVDSLLSFDFLDFIMAAPPQILVDWLQAESIVGLRCEKAAARGTTLLLLDITYFQSQTQTYRNVTVSGDSDGSGGFQNVQVDW